MIVERFRDRVAVVTGGGSGIGEATALRLASEGAAVVIAEIDGTAGERVAAELRASGGRAMAIRTDVSDHGQVTAMVRRTVDEMGPPDVLVNNAGINVFADPLALSDSDWRRCFAVDLDAAWYGCKAVLPFMLERGSGSIVNVGSVHSFQIIPHTFPYPVAKHGVVGLTRALAIEYAPRQVRINCVCPAYVQTQLTRDGWAATPDPELARAEAARLHPIQRVGQPSEIAAAIAFLASDDASFVTGAALMVDGGMSLILGGHGY
ncbi:MAG: SDR family oxidoreductase [Chloroflexota bacterium]